MCDWEQKLHLEADLSMIQVSMQDSRLGTGLHHCRPRGKKISKAKTYRRFYAVFLNPKVVVTALSLYKSVS